MTDGLLRQAANFVDLGAMEATGTTMFVVLIVEPVTERAVCAKRRGGHLSQAPEELWQKSSCSLEEKVQGSKHPCRPV